MTVITGIQTAIKIAPIVYKGLKIVYKASVKTKRGAQWLGRHPNIARYGTIAASSAPIIYDLLNIDYSAIQKRFPDKKQQARGKLYATRARQQYSTGYNPCIRYRPRKQRQFYRSRYR